MEVMGKSILIPAYILLNCFLSVVLGGLFYFIIVNAVRFSIHSWNSNKSNNFEFSLLDKNEEFSNPLKAIKKIHRIGLATTIIIFSIGFYLDDRISFYPMGDSFLELAIGFVFYVIVLAIINSILASKIRNIRRIK